MSKEKGLRIAKLCEVLNVTRSAYYAWDGRPESKRSIRKKELTERVKEEFFWNHKIPGARKIAKRLSTPTDSIGRNSVGKIMRENGWIPKVMKKYKATTNSNHNLPVAENLLNRDFHADKPNQKWVSDITYIATDEGWLYLAGIIDLCGREPVGWAMGERMTKELVITALRQAKGAEGILKGFWHTRIEVVNIVHLIINRS